MGFLDYLSDLYDALAVQTAEAEEQQQDGECWLVTVEARFACATENTCD